MTYFKQITNIIKEGGFDLLSDSEKKEYLLEVINNTILKEALKYNVSFNDNSDITSKVIGLNSILEDNRKKFNCKLLQSVLYVIGSIQNKKIIFEQLPSRYFINPSYTFENDKLIRIRSYSKNDQLEPLIYIVKYIETRFLLEKDDTLSLKK